MLAHVLLNYDVKMANDGERQSELWFGITSIPDPTTELMFRKRAWRLWVCPTVSKTYVEMLPVYAGLSGRKRWCIPVHVPSWLSFNVWSALERSLQWHIGADSVGPRVILTYEFYLGLFASQHGPKVMKWICRQAGRRTMPGRSADVCTSWSGSCLSPL